MDYRPSLGGTSTRAARRAGLAPSVLLVTVIALALALAIPSMPPGGDTDRWTNDGSGWSLDEVRPMSPGPDLNATPTDISLSVPSPRHGQPVTVTVRARNAGDGDALNVTVDLYDGNDTTGTRIGTWYIANASAGSSADLTVGWVATIGTHTLSVYLDTDQNVTEDSESNNEASRDVVVSGVPDVRLEQGAFLVSTNMAGQVTLVADALNGGNATAMGYDLAFYDGDPDAGGSLLGRVDLPDVPAGSRATGQVTFTAGYGEVHLFARLEGTDTLDPSTNDQVDRVVWFTAPIAALAGPDRVAFAGQDLTFNGSRSGSTGGSITNFTWELGDGDVAYGPVVVHNYTNSGTVVRTLTARLTVRDAGGRSATDTATVHINPVGSPTPTADAGTPPSGQTMEDLAFDGSSSTGNITSYAWEFGDNSSATGSSVSHSYWQDGTYTVSLVVIDNVSLADADTVQVTVSNRDPLVAELPDIGTDLGVSHDLLVLAYDEDGYIASYSWDFGDGTTSDTRDPTHSWSSDGSHLVSVNVTDDDGAYVVRTFYVNVTDVAPVASFVYTPSNPREGVSVSVDASASSDPGNDIAKYEWDWETDGTYDNDTGPASRITYNKPGTYLITLRVTDGEGSTNTTTRQVEVQDVAPTARASLTPSSIEEGGRITFNASTSDEPGRDFVAFFWDLDGDGTYELETSGPLVVRTMTRAGTFLPRLIVRDEDGSNSTPYSPFFFRYTVTNMKPLVNYTLSSGLEGEPITVSVEVDEPGNDLVDFYWDFDMDGSIDAHTNVSHVNHTFWTSGSFDVWVNVTDTEHMNPDPSWGAGIVKVDVEDVAPRPFVEDGMAVEGAPTTFTVQLRGTELNVTSFLFDLDGDGAYEVQTSDQSAELTFYHRGENGNVECWVKAVDTDGSEGSSRFTVYVYDVAPTVTAPPFIITIEGERTQVEVTAHEPGMDIVEYRFDWNGDGTPENVTTEPWATHVYLSPGAKRLVVTVEDEDGSTGSATVQVLVYNRPPTAHIAAPGEAKEGESIELSAAASGEPGGHIVTYEWDFDGDGLYDVSTRDPVVEHAWMAPGNYTVFLRVTDSDGTFDEDFVQVTVLNVDPVADLVVTVNPEDRPSVLDASGSYDPGGIRRYVWNITAYKQQMVLDSEEPILLFTFDRRVDYSIELLVYDPPAEGGRARLTRTIESKDVRTLPPQVVVDVPLSVAEGEPVAFHAWATDPFPDDPTLSSLRIITYTWDFGDGTFGSGAEVTHVYERAAAGPYTVKLTVTDEDDDRTGPLTANITVSNPPPLIHAVEPIIVKRGDRGETTITAEDATSSGVGLTFVLAPNAPDWASMEGGKLVVEPGTDVDPATYMVTVRVLDVLDAESQTTVPVVVLADQATSGITWGQLLIVVVPMFLVVLVVAILVARMFGPSGGTRGREEEAGDASEYERLYGTRARKVRAVSRVETEKVDVEVGRGEDGADAAATATPYEVPQPPPAPEASYEVGPEPPVPLPSWMTPSVSSHKEEVSLPERAMEPPPTTPAEWERPKAPPPDHPYRYRGPRNGESTRYRGAGPPRT